MAARLSHTVFCLHAINKFHQKYLVSDLRFYLDGSSRARADLTSARSRAYSSGKEVYRAKGQESRGAVGQVSAEEGSGVERRGL